MAEEQERVFITFSGGADLNLDCISRAVIHELVRVIVECLQESYSSNLQDLTTVLNQKTGPQSSAQSHLDTTELAQLRILCKSIAPHP